MNYEQLARFIGPFDTYEDYNTNTKVFRTADGSIYRVGYDVLAMLHNELEIFRYLVDLMGRKQIEESKLVLLESDNSTNAKRIREINKELDIIRGVVPTPKGYKIDLQRAKDLMSELKKLLAKKEVTT